MYWLIFTTGRVIAAVPSSGSEPSLLVIRPLPTSPTGFAPWVEPVGGDRSSGSPLGSSLWEALDSAPASSLPCTMALVG